jgi:SAM-dependent methyltransferase
LALVREQLTLAVEYKTNGHAELRDAAAAQNKSLPVHRWVPWIAGFSAQFVEDAIEAYLPKMGRGQHQVLDPFAGVGTTMVEALKAGCNTIGYEINAFAVLAARAKANCVDLSSVGFAKQVDAFRCALQRFESGIDRRWAAGGAEAMATVLETLGTARPSGFRSRIPFFSPPIEAKFLYALGRAAALPEPGRTLFRAALGATMISYSNYSYEPSLSSRPGAGKPVIENASVVLPVCRKLDEMLEDIQWAQARFGTVWRARRREAVHASYFNSKVPAGSVSLLVTSPPYMNNYHYVRNTRPQLHWLGLIGGADDLRQCEQESFGKFWQTVRQAPPVDLEVDFPDLVEKIRHLRGLNVGRRQYGGPGWANYVTTYFNDSNRFLGLVKRQLRAGGRAIIVIGNSIIQGVEFKVDHLLAEMAERHDLEVEGIQIVRKKRVGNSIIGSSVRNGHDHQDKHKTQLYDAAVILRA